MAAQAMVLAIAPLGGAMAAMVAERLITGTSWRPAMRDALGLAVVATAVSFWASTVIDGGLLVLSAALGLVLILLAEIDRRTMLLPDVITYPLIAAGLATTWVLMPERMAAHIIGAIAGFAAFAIIARAYKMLRGRDGLGLGDAKLMAAAGAWLGWLALPGVVVMGAVAALVFAVSARFSGRAIDAGQAIPFGPFLGLGIWISWLYGPVTFAW